MIMTWHGFVSDLSNGVEGAIRYCYEKSPLVRGTVQAATDLCTGVGILSRRLRKAPDIAVNFFRRCFFSAVYRGGFTAALLTMQGINTAILKPYDANTDSVFYYPWWATNQLLQQMLLLRMLFLTMLHI